MSTTTTQTQAVTAQNVLRLFPDVETVNSSHTPATAGGELQGYDAEQVRLMEEMCIVLDDDDKPIGRATKKVCHLMKNIDDGLLHRAFSVFLFDSNNKLLMQQRAHEKITFPDMWTNTCCSHPLDEPGETGVGAEAIEGAKRAAQRKLYQELGIKENEVPLDKFFFLTRIHYKAPCGDGKWGEHEIDYILFIKADVNHTPNPNEVQDSKFVAKEELEVMLKNNTLNFTPWFKLIYDSMLYKWWENLDDGLDKYTNEEGIRRM